VALTIDELQTALDALPRVPLGIFPTPLVDAPRLADALGLRRLLIKRDDLTGLAFGGNKVRQMEFFMGDARAAGADLLIAGGSFDQSNHARVAAGAARAAGMRSLIVARPGGTHPGPQGNGLLTRFLADEFVVLDELAAAPTDRLAEVRLRAEVFGRLAEARRAEGARPYVLTGTTIPLGAMGYVAGGLELIRQLAALKITRPIVAVTSAGATQAGLEIANRLVGEPVLVQGLAYAPTNGRGSHWVADLIAGGAALLGETLSPDPATIANDDAAAGPGYGAMTDERRAAMQLAAMDGLILDPVYTATGMAGLIRLAAAGRLADAEAVVFIHTGGLPAIFAYGADILAS
jgi:1-aminocyclopropane-1-carboxylate deaminase/D-cysteine desulfhydrase-like pyridoxal-dependent ACC family enzyme